MTVSTSYAIIYGDLGGGIAVYPNGLSTQMWDVPGFRKCRWCRRKVRGETCPNCGGPE